MLLWNQIGGLATSLALAIPFVQQCDTVPGDEDVEEILPEGDQPCCEQSDAPACKDPDVVACVCARDLFCCAVRWDEVCAGQADEYCDADCS